MNGKLKFAAGSHKPEGEAKVYDLSAVQISQSSRYDFSGVKTNVVLSADKEKVYFQDLSTAFGFGTWVSGDVRGDTVYIQNGQSIHHQDADGPYPELDIYLKSAVLSDGRVVLTDDEYVKLAVHDDGAMTIADGMGIAAVDQYDMTYAYNSDYRIVPFDSIAERATPPANIESEPYSVHYKEHMFGNDIYRLVNLKIDEENNAIYVQGLNKYYAPDSWIKGDVEDDAVSFRGRQYLATADDSFLNFFYPGHVDSSSSFGYALDDELVFHWDRQNQRLTSSGTALDMIGDRIFVDGYEQPVLEKYVPKAAYPAKPQMRDYTDYREGNDGFIVVRFTILPVAEDGTYINPDALTWKLYVDGKPYTFEKSTYVFLPADESEFLWGFSDGIDIVFESYGLYNIWFYDDCSELAVECAYTYEGKTYTTMSDSMTIASAGVIGLSEEGQMPVETIYYDLSGRAIEHPLSGIYIKKDVLKDGSARINKIRIK